MIFLFSLLCSATLMGGLGDIWQNNQASKHLAQGKVTQAHESFIQLLSEQPFNPIFQYNLGVSFIAVEELDKAIEMYKDVLKMKPLPPEVAFASYYNLGVLHSPQGERPGDLDQALANYQAALEFQPDSLEIKTNIELLIKEGGGGKGQQNQDQKDSSDPNKANQDPSQQGEDQENQKFTNKPQPNQSKDKPMSKEDVKKILEELKKQEQRIRAKHDRKGKKRTADREKNW